MSRSSLVILLLSWLFVCGFFLNSINAFSYENKEHFTRYSFGQYLVYNTLYPNATDIDYHQTYHCPNNGLKDNKGKTHSQLNEIKILFIGDSYHRHIITEFCEAHNSPVTDWYPNIFRLEKFLQSFTCRVGNIVLHQIPIYSGYPHGPYHHGHISTNQYPYIDTEPRVPKIIEMYKQDVGEPTFLFLRTDIWDLATLLRLQKLNVPSALFDMKTNFERWLLQFEQAFPNSYIGTHTIPMIQWAELNDAFPHVENLLRIITSEHETMFFMDWHVALLHKKPSEINRDIIHPIVTENLIFMKHILQVFSSWLTYSCELSSTQTSSSSNSNVKVKPTMNISNNQTMVGSTEKHIVSSEEKNKEKHIHDSKENHKENHKEEHKEEHIKEEHIKEEHIKEEHIKEEHSHESSKENKPKEIPNTSNLITPQPIQPTPTNYNNNNNKTPPKHNQSPKRYDPPHINHPKPLLKPVNKPSSSHLRA